MKTTFSNDELIEILAGYPVGGYQSHTLFTQGSVQTNILLQTTTGAYVLRYYEQGRTAGSVRFEVNLLTYLQQKKYPCPAPLRNKHGHAVGSYHAKPYVLFTFLEGDPVQAPSEGQKQQLIQKAAELHLLTRTYRPTYKAERWNYSVALCQTLAEKATNALGTVAAQEKLAWLRHEVAALQLPASLPKGICHADFHFSNVLFKGDTFAALLDFDDANYTFLLYDLVGLIESSAWPYAAGALRFPEAQKVVSTYTTYRALNPTEKRHLFDVYKLSILIDCVWYFGRGDSPDFYEKRKIDYLNALGRTQFYTALFGEKERI